MEKLQRLVTDTGPINIIDESARNFQKIGTILLSNTRVCNIEASVRGNQVEAVREIYRQWMQEDVDYSWTKLTQCLRQCDLNVLASQIEQHFGLLPASGGICIQFYIPVIQLNCHSVHEMFSFHLQSEKSMDHLNKVTVVCYRACYCYLYKYKTFKMLKGFFSFKMLMRLSIRDIFVPYLRKGIERIQGISDITECCSESVL